MMFRTRNHERSPPTKIATVTIDLVKEVSELAFAGA